MKKIAALAALAVTGLGLAAPAASAATAQSPDALGGLSSGFQLSPADLVLDTAAELPVTGQPVKAVKELGRAQVEQQVTNPGLHGQIG